MPEPFPRRGLTSAELADLLYAWSFTPVAFRQAIVDAYGLAGDHPDAWVTLSPQQAADLSLAACLRADLDEQAA
jgi:hypothetical protein